VAVVSPSASKDQQHSCLSCLTQEQLAELADLCAAPPAGGSNRSTPESAAPPASGAPRPGLGSAQLQKLQRVLRASSSLKQRLAQELQQRRAQGGCPDEAGGGAGSTAAAGPAAEPPGDDAGAAAAGWPAAAQTAQDPGSTLEPQDISSLLVSLASWHPEEQQCSRSPSPETPGSPVAIPTTAFEPPAPPSLAAPIPAAPIAPLLSEQPQPLQPPTDPRVRRHPAQGAPQQPPPPAALAPEPPPWRAPAAAFQPCPYPSHNAPSFEVPSYQQPYPYQGQYHESWPHHHAAAHQQHPYQQQHPYYCAAAPPAPLPAPLPQEAELPLARGLQLVSSWQIDSSEVKTALQQCCLHRLDVARAVTPELLRALEQCVLQGGPAKALLALHHFQACEVGMVGGWLGGSWLLGCCWAAAGRAGRGVTLMRSFHL
jgi:hypothetical protein